MCGICGIVSLTGPLDRNRAIEHVQGMVNTIAHRGPDDAGIYDDERAVLGATRLAIRGLESGRQPIQDPVTGIVTVCNGEIDNHHELRALLEREGYKVPLATDVAVLPALYDLLGERCVEQLIGVFALALWDPRKSQLLLARDRAGERSLFYQVDGAVIRFATELSAIAGVPAVALKPDSRALAGYLRFGSFSAPETPFMGIQKVCPAELICFDVVGTRPKRYWRWPVAQSLKSEPSVETFDQIFRTAVRRQSNVDVDFGLFLSGGIDSSLVAAVALTVAHKRPRYAYTIRFDEASYDEGAFAERIAQELALESVSVWVKPEDFPREISQLVRMVGEPLADPAWVPTAMLARRASQDVKMALVGEGADELFGGYPTYMGARLAEKYARCPRTLKEIARSVVEALPPSDKKVTLSFLLKRFVAGADLDGVERHLLWTSSLSPELIGRLGITRIPERAVERDGDLLDLVQRHDLETSLAEGLLTKADRASMLSALELRAPFLDRAVMEFAAMLPPKERATAISTKVFLKRFALRYLPKRIIYRKKRGLSVPLGHWLRGPLREWATERLSGDRLEWLGIEPNTPVKLLEEHVAREADHARALWTLLVLAEWVDWVRERGTVWETGRGTGINR
jgi:asparagine synthase (glutamine-hydrolysing)